MVEEDGKRPSRLRERGRVRKRREGACAQGGKAFLSECDGAG